VKTRLLAVLTGSLALFALVVLIFGDKSAGTVAERQLGSQLERARRSVERLLMEKAEIARMRVESLADLPKTLSLMDTDAATIRQALAPDLENFGTPNALICDANGKPFVGAAPSDPTPPLRNGDPNGAVFVENLNGDWYLSAFSWVIDPLNGAVKGSVRLRSPIGDALVADLHDAMGADVSILAGDTPVTANQLNLLQDVSRIGRSTQGVTSVRLGDEPSVASVAHTPFGLRVVLSRSLSSALQGWQAARATVAIVALLALFGAVAVGLRLSRGISEPIADIVTAAEGIRSGEWPDAIPTRGIGELNFLSETFNEMVAALRQQEARLMRVAYIDPLTDLHNLRFFMEHIKGLVGGDQFGFLQIDCDGLKAFNDRRGLSEGDRVLASIADTLRRKLPSDTLACRCAGEEFAAVLPACSPQRLQNIAESLRLAIEAELVTDGMTVTIGCAHYPESSQSENGLFLASELAIVQGKGLGGNRAVCYWDLPAAQSLMDPSNLDSSLRSGDLNTITALAAAVDAKDRYTHGHSASVSRFSLMLGQAIGLDKTALETLKLAALLHDVGKIGVPDAVLNKEGRLTDEEFETMKSHTTIGHAIALQANLNHFAPAIRSHHEQWCGHGYPDGLKGEQIPLMARIISIADSYDAMTSDRVYRKAPGVEFALDQITNGAGVQFDPDLAPVFVSLIRESMREAA